jgi:hypothetical protein
MSGAELIGLISGVITIFGTVKTLYDAAADAKGQPRGFRQVAARLPLIIELLGSAKGGVQKLNTTEQDALGAILQSCEEKAESLEDIFRRVLRKDDGKWYERYRKALDTITKGKTVECLMGEILKDVQVIVCDKLKDTATSDQVKELGEAIKEMNDLSPPLRKDEVGQHHSGSGNNIGIFGGSGHTQTNVQAQGNYVQHVGNKAA